MTQTNHDATRTVADYIAIYRRRRGWFWWPAGVILLAALAAALLLPSTYRAEGRILIEDQEISPNLLGDTVSGFTTQQIQVISQRVLTSARIREIVDDLEVYDLDESEGPLANELIAARFRNDMDLSIVRADVIDPRRGVGEAAIGFDLGFSSQDPGAAKRVAERLVDLFMQENSNRRQERAQDVTRFLADSVDKANEELERTEAELAAFKSANEGVLPEDYEENERNIRLAEQQLADAEVRIQQLEQRAIELRGQLAALNPSSPITTRGGDAVMSDRERLRVLSAEYREKSVRYRAGHPDLVRLEREIAALRNTVGDGDKYTQLSLQLEKERAVLSDAQSRYGDNHPDVVRAQATVDSLEAELATVEAAPGTTGVANNPAYLVVNTQVQSTQSELRSLRGRQQRLRADIARYQGLISRAPEVEVQYEGLRREYENAEASVYELQARLRAAEVADDVEGELLRGRFTLIEPPSMPLAPIGPNRPAMLLFGAILAVGIGGLLVVLAEAVDSRIYGMKTVTTLVGVPPLAVVPYLDNSADLAKAKRRKLAYVGAIGVVVIAAAYLLI